MANKKLRGIVWPNLPNDTYLLDSGEVDYSAEASYRDGTVGKALQSKASVDGSYADLTAGNAEQLVSSVRTNDKVPYLFRTSGGSVDIGDREYINGIVGVSLPWNQLIRSTTSTSTNNGITFTQNGDGTINVSGTATANAVGNIHTVPLLGGHTYLLMGCPSGGAAGKYALYANQTDPQLFDIGSGSMKKQLSDTTGSFYIIVYTGQTVNLTFTPHLFDLTQLFGSTIADYVYSLEQSTAGAGVAWFKKLFPKPYYPYDSGSLKSVEGLVSHDTTGFNQWDEELQSGYYDTDGTYKANNNFKCSKNPIPALPNTTYYLKAPVNMEVFAYDADMNFISEPLKNQKDRTFTTPSNTAFLHFCNYTSGSLPTYNRDICINFHWDGSRDGEYEPYVKHSYPLDSDVILRGKLMLDANNNLYANGDVYLPSGEVQRNWAEVDLGTLNWSEYGSTETVTQYVTSGIDTTVKTNGSARIAKFVYSATLAPWTWKIGSGNGKLALRTAKDAYASASAFKTAMSGEKCVYELATPTTESADPYTSPQIVDDFGTEQYALDDSAFPVPVGHDTDYPVNLVAKLEMSPNSPSGDGDYIVRQTNGENTYVPLVIEDALPTIPSATGSYKLTVTVAEGSDPVLSWEAE